MTRQLNFCPSVSEPFWQLHDKLNFHLPIAMLSWSLNAGDIEGGPPSDVIQVLTQALVQSHRVSFLVTEDSLPSIAQATGATTVQSLASRGIVSFLSAWWNAEPAHWHWLSTRDAAVAATLFDQNFIWTLQAQVVLLSAVDAAAPVLTLELTQALWRGGSPEAVAELVAAGVQVVIRPGVDGDAVGMVGLRAGAEYAWVSAIETQCRNLGLPGVASGNSR